ncbi:MAG TPA: hypothetical protein PKE58_02200 [Acidobacteriota bacterium]|nr:hypothetical protein [Acidobacteriota bacterium]
MKQPLRDAQLDAGFIKAGRALPCIQLTSRLTTTSVINMKFGSIIQKKQRLHIHNWLATVRANIRLAGFLWVSLWLVDGGVSVVANPLNWHRKLNNIKKWVRFDLQPRQRDPKNYPSQFELEAQTRAEIKAEEQFQKEFRKTYTEMEEAVKLFSVRWDGTSHPLPASLSGEDQKNLKKIEKLARKLSEGQGGDDDELWLKDLPTAFADRVKKLNELTAELKSEIEKTSRFTISIKIISKSEQIRALAKALGKGQKTSG